MLGCSLPGVSPGPPWSSSYWTGARPEHPLGPRHTELRLAPSVPRASLELTIPRWNWPGAFSRPPGSSLSRSSTHRGRHPWASPRVLLEVSWGFLGISLELANDLIGEMLPGRFIQVRSLWIYPPENALDLTGATSHVGRLLSCILHDGSLVYIYTHY